MDALRPLLDEAEYRSNRDDLPRLHVARDAHRIISEFLTRIGAELVTDWDRDQAGLPPRGSLGWTIEELRVLEYRRLEAMLQPMPSVVRLTEPPKENGDG